MKQLLLIACAAALVSCATNEPKPTAKEQVQGLQTMCKEAAPAMKARQEQKSLYLRLGQKKKIEVLVSKLYDAHKSNKDIGHMFKKVRKKPFSRNVVAFLTVGTGGGGKYTGRNMTDAHKHLKITNEDFLAAGGDVNAVMKEMKYGDNEIQEVVCALVSFVPQVVID